MARLNIEKQEKILADFHTGTFTQRELSKKHGVSLGTISKITKGLSPKNEHIVKAKASLVMELSDKSEQEVNAIEQAVHNLSFFQNSALKNQNFANKKIDENSELMDLKIHADLTSKNKQSVLGRDADTQVNIQTNTQVNLNQGLEWE